MHKDVKVAEVGFMADYIIRRWRAFRRATGPRKYIVGTIIVKLEWDIEPKLEILFGTGDPFERYTPVRSGVPAIRIVRVCVKNNSGAYIDNGKLVLKKMLNYSNAFTPITMKQMNDDPSDILNTPHKQEFSLNARGDIYIDIAEYREGEDRRPEAVRLCYATEGHRSIHRPNTIPSTQSYDLFLEASCRQGDPCEERCRLWVDNNDRLNLSRS